MMQKLVNKKGSFVEETEGKKYSHIRLNEDATIRFYMADESTKIEHNLNTNRSATTEKISKYNPNFELDLLTLVEVPGESEKYIFL